MSNIKVLIADDHQLVVDGLKHFVNSDPRFEVVGEANNGQDAVLYTKALSPQMVMMDIDMPIMSGIQALTQIKNESPIVKVLIISMHYEKPVIKKVMNLGADGYLVKNASQSEVINTLESIINGEKQFPKDLLNEIQSTVTSPLANSEDLSQLTDREIEIIRLVAQGLSNKEIGEKLFISHRTVDTHRTNLMKKLSVNNVAGLIRFAFIHHLVQ